MPTSIPTHNHLRELKSLRDELVNRVSENARLQDQVRHDSRNHPSYNFKRCEKLKLKQSHFSKQIEALNVSIKYLETLIK